MDRSYQHLPFFFIAAAAITFVGFYHTYFVLFPEFEGIKTFHHVHAFGMILWLLVLIVQPILINKRKYKWHRAIGKASYLLVPFIVISMLVAYKHSFLDSLSEDGLVQSRSLVFLFMPLTDVLPFTTFYLLAIVNKKKTANHLRYMISTAVIIVSAGFLRIFMKWLGLNFMEALYASIATMALIFVGLIFNDMRNGMLSKNKSFLTAFVIFALPNVLLLFVPYTAWWRSLAEGLIN